MFKKLVLETKQSVYFLSDFHLGVPNPVDSLVREKKIVTFLDGIKADALAIFIVGDMFDFWYEYKHVVPRGYTRIFGKLAELTDSGIAVHFFVGNHDMWMKDYFQKELNIPVYFGPKIFEFNGKKFYVAHGDGLGPGDNGYKFLKKVFRNPVCQWLFGILPPKIGIGLANYFSQKSKDNADVMERQFLGEDGEWLIVHSKEILQEEHFDYFIYGHRHVPSDFRISPTSRYINLGDWIGHYTYAIFNGNDVELRIYES